MFRQGVRGHLVAAHFAAPLLIARRGLVVLTCYAHPDPDSIALHVYYDVAMNAISRLAFGLRSQPSTGGISPRCAAPE